LLFRFIILSPSRKQKMTILSNNFTPPYEALSLA
jgi:hypothetical protein